MKQILLLFIAMIAMFTSSLAGVPDEIRQNLDKLVPETIRLLEAKDYPTVLETLVPPDMFKKMVAEGQLEKIAENFSKGKAARLLEVMKMVKDLKPVLSEDGTVATYETPEVPEFSKKKHRLLENRWLLVPQ